MSNVREALEIAVAAMERYGPEPGHDGSCGPWANCDGACMEFAAYADALRTVRAALNTTAPAPRISAEAIAEMRSRLKNIDDATARACAEDLIDAVEQWAQQPAPAADAEPNDAALLNAATRRDGPSDAEMLDWLEQFTIHVHDPKSGPIPSLVFGRTVGASPLRKYIADTMTAMRAESEAKP
jgi:hypothetical protein